MTKELHNVTKEFIVSIGHSDSGLLSSELQRTESNIPSNFNTTTQARNMRVFAIQLSWNTLSHLVWCDYK